MKNYKINKGGQWQEMISEKWENVLELMDDDIREELHCKIAPCTEEEFLTEYCKKHFEKFGDTFIAEHDNPIW